MIAPALTRTEAQVLDTLDAPRQVSTGLVARLLDWPEPEVWRVCRSLQKKGLVECGVFGRERVRCVRRFSALELRRKELVRRATTSTCGQVVPPVPAGERAEGVG